MKLYPVNIDLFHRRCLIVGGGTVAFRKLKRLLACSAIVTVISPEFAPDFFQISTDNHFMLIKREVKKTDIDHYFMVFATTSDAKINEALSEWARQKNILCNIADNPNLSDFTLPSVVEQGDLNITISTNGKSPALSKHLRKQFMQLFGQEYAIFLTIMGNLREILGTTKTTPDDRKIKYHELIDNGIIQKIKEKDIKSISKILVDITGYQLNDVLEQTIISKLIET